MAFIQRFSGGMTPYSSKRSDRSVSKVSSRKQGKPRMSPATASLVRAVGTQVVKKLATSTVRRRRRRSLSQRIVPRATGSTFSYFRSFLRPTKAVIDIQRENAKDVYRSVSTTRLTTTTTGIQTTLDIPIAPSSLLTTLSNAIWGAHIVPGKFVLNYVDMVLMVTNQDSTNAFLDIYEIYSRKDASSSAAVLPTTLWNSGLTSENAVLSSTLYQLIASKPFHSNAFCTAHHVDKIYRIELEPGKTHRHSSRYQLNSFVRDEDLGRASYSLGGLTRFVMLVASGTPVNSTATPSLVSTSNVTMNVVYTTTYSYTYNTDAQTSYTYTGSLASIPAGSVSVMNEDTNTATTETNA